MGRYFLVVDDSELNLQVVKSLLELNGATADYATSAEAAYAQIAENTYNLIFMDYLMPGTNGLDATKHIRKMQGPHSRDYYKNIPIIALTAEDDKKQLTELIKAGINDILIKPITPDSLHKIIKKYAPTVTGIDEDTLQSMLAADEASYCELIKVFCADIEGKKSRIAAALAAGDYPNYVVEVHKIKGEAKVIGAAELANSAKELEFAGKTLTGVYDNGKSSESNRKYIDSHTPAVISLLESTGRDLLALTDRLCATADSSASDDPTCSPASDKSSESGSCTGSASNSDSGLNADLRDKLEKLTRYTAHALEALNSSDYSLTGEWLGEMTEILQGILNK